MQKEALYLWITIIGCDDSTKLWNAIEQYKVNLTDLGDKAYIYGEVQMPEAIEIIGVANDYGETEVSLSIVGRAAQ